jgi:hypothetical protein
LGENGLKKIYSILLCIILFAVQCFSVTGTVFAEGELQVATEVTGMMSYIDDQPFVPLMGLYSIRYQIVNNSYDEIKDIQLMERLQGESEFRLVDMGKTKLDPGESMTLTGSDFVGELASNPNVVQYVIQYEAKGNDNLQETAGYTTVKVIDVRMDVTYTSPLQGPVFKGEKASLKVEVKSNSNVVLYNLTVTDRDLGQELGTIDVLVPGQTATVEAAVALENSTRGNLTITYDDPMGLGEKFQKSFDTDLEIEVKQEAPLSSLNVSGTSEKRLIPGQAEVKFELKIKNTGNTVLKQLECLDWDGKVFHTIEQLLPEEEISVKYTGEVKPDTSYELKAQAKVEDTNQLIQSSWQVELEKLDPRVEIERTIVPEAVEAGEPFVLEYIVRNTGNVDLVDVVVEEPEFGEIAAFDIIEAGREVDFKKELTINKDAVSKTVLTARDAEWDAEYSYDASELTIPIGGGSPDQALSIALTSDKTDMNKPGTVEMECIVKNSGRQPLYNLVLTLMDREMVINNISVLEPGEEKVFWITPFRVEETETFFVEANGLGVNQEKFTAKSKPLTIKVEKGGLSGQDSILRVILIVIILFCILIVGALVYLLFGSGKYRRKRKTVRER